MAKMIVKPLKPASGSQQVHELLCWAAAQEGVKNAQVHKMPEHMRVNLEAHVAKLKAAGHFKG